MSQREDDLQLLRTVLASDKLSDDNREAFEDMLTRLDGQYLTLNEKQRAYVKGVGERHELLIEYENGISSGKVPRGREVALMVKDKPLRPPTRRSD